VNRRIQGTENKGKTVPKIFINRASEKIGTDTRKEVSLNDLKWTPQPNQLISDER
jgi:hypothetical protein